MKGKHLFSDSTRAVYFKTVLPRAMRLGKIRSRCNKVCYPSRKVAKQNLQRITRAADFVESDRPFREYYCSACDAWHLGHSSLPHTTRRTA